MECGFMHTFHDPECLSMTPRARKTKPLHERTLAQLINLVISHKFPFEDLAEFIEDRAYEVCQESNCTGDIASRQLRRLAAFFEEGRDSDDECARALADVYVMIGELYLYHDQSSRAVRWFKRAISVCDDSAPPYHSLAQAQIRSRDLKGAIRSMEEELLLAPGNLYTYLLLSDLYEQVDNLTAVEETLHRLLVRDAENIQALHRLIKHYEKHQPDAEVELLRRRVLSIRRDFSKIELIIWTYHACREGRLAEAMGFLQDLSSRSPENPTLHLLTAAVYGEMRQFTKKKRALATFKQLVDGNGKSISGELRDFSNVFGQSALAKLGKRLAISSPSAVQG
jgi:tetratricopeptide (TPR) repeat protein